MAEEFRVLRPREYHTQLVSKKQRADGRTLEEWRAIKLETDAIKTADSSSLVKLGNTSLVCGCILRTQDNDDGDKFELEVDLPPICSTPTSNNTPQHTAQLLTKTLKNILEDYRCLDGNDFKVDKESNQFYSVYVEIICLNYDGCLIDAALIGILSALKSIKVGPKLVFRAIPVCSTFAVIGNQIICDPNLEEENVAASTFSITIDLVNGDSCRVSKFGGKSLTSGDLIKCIQLAKQRAATLHDVLKL